MANLETKVTVTAVDKASPALKNVAKSMEGLKKRLGPTAAGMARFQQRAKTMIIPLKALGIAAVAAGAAIFGASIATAKAASNIESMAAKTGLSVEAYQELSFAAKQATVSQIDFDRSLVMLTQSMGKALNPASEEAKAFKAAGISIQDASGEMKDSQEILLQLSDAFKDSNDQVREANTLFTIFKDRNLVLADFMKLGRTQIRETGKELSHIMTEDQIKQASEYNVQLIKAGHTFKQLTHQLGAAVIPAFTPLLEDLADFIKNNEAQIKSFFSGLADTVKTMAPAFKSMVASMQPMMSFLRNDLIPAIDDTLFKLFEISDKIKRFFGAQAEARERLRAETFSQLPQDVQSASRDLSASLTTRPDFSQLIAAVTRPRPEAELNTVRSSIRNSLNTNPISGKLNISMTVDSPVPVRINSVDAPDNIDFNANLGRVTP